jgi:hypothetical protein
VVQCGGVSSLCVVVQCSWVSSVGDVVAVRLHALTLVVVPCRLPFGVSFGKQTVSDGCESSSSDSDVHTSASPASAPMPAASRPSDARLPGKSPLFTVTDGVGAAAVDVPTMMLGTP